MSTAITRIGPLTLLRYRFQPLRPLLLVGGWALATAVGFLIVPGRPALPPAILEESTTLLPLLVLAVGFGVGCAFIVGSDVDPAETVL
ncbi:MAG: hypothetical protein QOH90_596, partial [Actinomycetota bacterium]|nr:hypothetical protein [Actinomycetota bacterium]